jgi:hypothetical protein
VAKFRDEFIGKSQKPVPPPMPPEYTAEELIQNEKVAAIPAPRGNGNETMAEAATR